MQAAVAEAVSRGTSYGTPTRSEVELAEAIVERTPVEKVRLVSSGTEATMSAIRLARGFTGRDLVVKFAGCYHGHVDSLLAEAGSGLATHRIEGAVPGTPGVPAASTAATLVLPYNDREAVEAAFAERGSEIACLVTEASPGNMGVVPPEPGFNQFLAETCARHGALFVSDEVMTGFRVSPPGPVGPRRRPRGLAARPGHLRQGDGRRLPGGGVRWPRRRDVDALPGRAGLPGRHALREPGRDDRRAGHAAARDRRGLRAHRRRGGRRCPPLVGEELTRAGVPHVVQSGGNMFSVFFTADAGPGARLRRRRRARTPSVYKAFFHAMLDQGVYLPPSAFEAWFLSAAHDDRALQHVIDALPAAARRCCGGGGVKTIVHLLRHGEVHNPQGILYGRSTGYHLSERGRAMADRVADRIGDRDITHIVSSPLERAQETAMPLAAVRGLTVELDERVIESGNIFEGKPFDLRDSILTPAADLVGAAQPVQAVVGRALQGRRRPDVAGRAGRRARPPRATRPSWSPTSCRSG